MPLALKKEATRPAGANILEQQGKFDGFINSRLLACAESVASTPWQQLQAF